MTRIAIEEFASLAPNNIWRLSSIVKSELAARLSVGNALTIFSAILFADLMWKIYRICSVGSRWKYRSLLNKPPASKGSKSIYLLTSHAISSPSQLAFAASVGALYFTPCLILLGPYFSPLRDFFQANRPRTLLAASLTSSNKL